MPKIITQQQIEGVLQIAFDTNISAKTFHQLKDFFDKLPEQVEEKKKDK
jgi:hypothetical protein